MSLAFRLALALLLLFPAAVAGDFHSRIRAIERRHGGRLGVAVVGRYPGPALEYRPQERFAMCSTFKLLLVAAVLARVDHGEESLDRFVAYGPSDLLDYSPITRQHVAAGGMRIESLCAAAIAYSDNTAANLLLATLGGPRGLTAYVRSLGDAATRLDRNESALNSNLPQDPRDSSTPLAMANTTQRVLAGGGLSRASADRLGAYLRDSTTGFHRLRAGFPDGWRVGDKTGTSVNGATNDVAVAWPQDRPPIFIVVFYTGSREPLKQREQVLAAVGRVVAKALGSVPFASRSHSDDTGSQTSLRTQ